MYFYELDGLSAASYLPDLPFPQTASGTPSLFLTERDGGPAAFRATWSHHLTELAGRGRCSRPGSPVDGG